MPLDLEPILATPITGDTVGAPPDADTTIAAVSAQGWSLPDLSPPVVTLRSSAIDHNLGVMADWIAERGVGLFPHGKTTMAPQLWSEQLSRGAGGITAATPAQVRAMRSVGVERVMLANELVDESSIAWVARELDDDAWDLACWADSVAAVELVAAGLRAHGAPKPLAVFTEVGHADGRTGARSSDEAAIVAEAIDRAPELQLRGVAGYEGTIANGRTAESISAVDAFLSSMREVAERVDAMGAVDGPVTVTAGGSVFFDRVPAAFDGSDRFDVVIRAGCTLTHDHGQYMRNTPLPNTFRPAIEAWASVLSRPEADVVVIGLGKRDVPFDIDPPVALRARDDDRSLDGLEVVRLMDQHAICRVPADVTLAPGDIVCFGISHPCTAFDRRRVLFVLDDDDRVVDAIATSF